MIGAIIGDITGSLYERYNIKTTDFELQDKRSRFTDDTVLTIAISEAILRGHDYAQSVRKWGLRYPNAGYGDSFKKWLSSTSLAPYNSWGNGSAMRVSPIGFAFNDLDRVLEEAKSSAAITHNHPEGIKGAQATAAAIFYARTGRSKDEIRDFIESTFKYNLSRKIDDIRPNYKFDVSCQGTVPEAIIAFLESKDFEHSIRLAVSLGGDSDTLACINGAIAQAFYKKIDNDLISFALKKLPNEMAAIIDEFSNRFPL